MVRAGNAVFIRTLERIIRSAPNEGNLCCVDEGEEFVCSTCSLPTKPCLKYPGAQCSSMRLEGTLIDLIDRAASEFTSSGERHCVVCGTALTMQQLFNDPLTEVCRACRPRVRHVRRSVHQSGV